jgi:hypothetical protein
MNKTGLLIIFLVALYSCQTKKNSSINNESAIISDTSTTIESVNYNSDLAEMDCVRGAAEPIIKKSVFPNSEFVLQPDKITGIETVQFENGDKLIIKNWGCESYCLTFRFETSRFQDDTTNIQFWFKKSVLLMSEIQNGLDCPIDIEKGTHALINFIDNDLPNDYANLKLKNEVDFGGEEIRDYVAIDRIQKINEKVFAVEISYVTGPL